MGDYILFPNTVLLILVITISYQFIMNDVKVRKYYKNHDEEVLPKKRSKRLSSSNPLMKEDKDYRPPHNPQTRSRLPKRPKFSIPRPAQKNLRDPFMVLDDDMVFMIIDQLSSRETEILRRVSKFWKANSEVHCGRNALQKFFPQAASNAGEHLSRAEENLRFRRHCKCV